MYMPRLHDVTRSWDHGTIRIAAPRRYVGRHVGRDLAGRESLTRVTMVVAQPRCVTLVAPPPEWGHFIGCRTKAPRVL